MATAQMQIQPKKDFKNWFKCTLAFRYVKPVLETFVDTEITEFHKHLLQLPQLSKNNKCSCSLKRQPKCPNSMNKGTWICKTHVQNVQTKRHFPCTVCTAIATEICLNHRFRGPSWKCTDPQKWCTDAFQIALCYMPLDGYSGKTSLVETDLNGVLSVIINNKVFQKKIKDNLDDEKNICTQVRTKGNELRHTADNLMSDDDLTSCIDILITLLSDPIYFAKDQKARDAVEKLKQLKTNSFYVHENDILEVLSDTIYEFNKEQKRLLEQMRIHLHQVKDRMAAFDKYIAEMFDKVETFKQNAIDDIRKETLRGTSNKENEKASKSTFSLKKYWPPFSRNISDKNISKDLNDWKNDLISHYNQMDSTIQISPLNDLFRVPLDQFHIQPTLEVVETFELFASHKETSDKRLKLNYKDLLSELQYSYHEYIYVSAEAGMGKTSLIKRLIKSWCTAHSPSPTTTRQDFYNLDEIEIMKTFSFLFFIDLADYKEVKTCNINELISTHVFKRLSNTMSSTKDKFEIILQNALRKERVLVLLDSLDEWTHPDNNCDCKTRDKPHRFDLAKNCKVLITTRTWKLSFIEIASNDLHVRICMLDDESVQKLDKKAIDLMPESIKAKKKIDDFEKNALSIVSEDIRYIPYIRLQMIWLWLNDQSLGCSKCELYSNFIELTLKRGLKKIEISRIRPSLEDHYLQLPECLKSKKMCLKYVHILCGLGQEAFRSSFRANGISTFVIDTEQVLEHLTEKDLEFCLKVGLLSQTKRTFLSSCRNEINFQQKIIHEFCSALYVSYGRDVSFERDSNQRIILDVCSSMSAIIEKSSFFIFLCGMNSAFYSRISEQLQQVVAKASSTTERKLDSKDEIVIRDQLFSYQSLQISCFREDHSFALYLQDVVLIEHQMKSDYVTDLYTMLGSNKRHVKSLLIYGNNETDEISRFIANVNPDTWSRLETLHIDVQDELNEMSVVLSKSADTLKRLFIRFMLVDNQIANLLNLKNLQIINLSHIGISHSVLESCLCEIGKQMTVIAQLTVILDKCDDCSESKCSGIPLNFSNNKIMQVLHLSGVAVCELRINTNCLEECVITTDLICHRISLPHMNIDELFDSFQNGYAIRVLTLGKIECSNHFAESYNSNSLDCPGGVLNLSGLKHLHKLHIDSSRVGELHFNISCLEDCYIKNVLLPKHNLNQVHALLCQISQLKTLHLENITMLKHTETNFECTLNLLLLSQLQKLILKNIPVSELRVSTKRLEECKINSLCLHPNNKFTQAKESKPDQLIVNPASSCNKFCVTLKHNKHGSKLKNLSIEGMPLSEVSVNTKYLEKFKLNSTCSLKRDKMQILYSEISEGEMLRQLELENLASPDDDGGFFDLNLSKLCQLRKLNLRDIVLNELTVNFDSVQECEIHLENDVSSSTLENLYDSIGKGKMMKSLYLKKKYRSEGSEELTLNISKLEQLEKLHIENIYINDIQLSNQCLAECKIIGLIFLRHRAICKLYDDIENAKKLKQLHMESITCLEHKDDCPKKDVNVLLSKHLETLHLESLTVSELHFNLSCIEDVCITNITLSHRSIEQIYPMFTFAETITKLELINISEEPFKKTDRLLDLSQLKRLQILRLINISTSQLRVTTECVEKCEICRLSMPHDTLKDIYDSMCKATLLKQLILNNITCAEHSSNCNGLHLKLNQQLQTLRLGNISVSHFRVNTECIEKCEICKLSMPHDTLKDIYDSMCKATLLKQLILNNITCAEHSSNCNGLHLKLNQQLQTLRLGNISASHFRVNTECIEKCEICSLSIPHDTLKDIYDAICKANKFKELILNNIICHEHRLNCKGLPLKLNGKGNLQKLRLVGIPLTEFCVKAEYLREFELSVYGSVQLDDLNDFIGSITNTKMMNICKVSKFVNEEEQPSADTLIKTEKQ